jgi:mRNA-degrading endonuclease RelE of RelBE toxin-antitoxin system
MFSIRIAALALSHLRTTRPYDRNRILDAMTAQLAHDLEDLTPHRKQLAAVVPSFEHVPSVWQLRVGDFRVIYDVDAVWKVVIVRAVLRKGRRTTKEIL